MSSKTFDSTVALPPRVFTGWLGSILTKSVIRTDHIYLVRVGLDFEFFSIKSEPNF